MKQVSSIDSGYDFNGKNEDRENLKIIKTDPLGIR